MFFRATSHYGKFTIGRQERRLAGLPAVSDDGQEKTREIVRWKGPTYGPGHSD